MPVAEAQAVKPNSREQAIVEIDQSPLTEQQFEQGVAQGNIEVTEIETQFAPGIEDAAMLYANGRVEDVTNLLKAFIQQEPQEDSVWLMLFDVYCVTRQQQAFEQLALDYAVQCEKSPPIWVDAGSLQQEQAPFQTSRPVTNEGQLFSLAGRLDHSLGDKIKVLLETAGSGVVQLDLSGLTEVDDEGCMLLQMALAKLQKQQSKLQIASGALIGLLQQYVARTTDNTPEPWLLLLQLYQLQGKQAEFEDLAVEFAIYFELSPPSWDAPKQVAQIVVVAEPEVSVDTDSNVFKMTGTISASSAAQLNEIKLFGATHSEVIIDMSGVDRVEFGSVGLLMDALMALIPSGKKIQIIGSNRMVYVLMVVMGVDQMAQIVPRK